MISRGASDAAEVVDVELRHEGVSGFGEAAPIERYDESPASALAFLEDAGELLGDDPFAFEEIEARLRERPGEQAAKAAIDAALHDLCGKLVGLPVWRLLGLRRDGPPTSWTIWLGDPDDMARRAEKVQGRFQRLKLKLGAGDGLDVERVARRARRHRRAAAGRRERVVVARRGARGAAAARRARRPVLRAAAPRRRPGRPGAEAPLAAPDLRRRGLPHARRRRRLRRARARADDQARQVGRDPRGGADGPRRPRARARR